MKYIVYGNTGAIDSFEAEDGYTIERYLDECKANGCEYDNPDELYLEEVSEDE